MSEGYDPRPRLVKIVRDDMERWLPDTAPVYRRIESAEVTRRELRKKLVEECAEYLLDPSVGELADLLEMLHALAAHDLGVVWTEVTREMMEKAGERGGISNMAMYVETVASPRHEGDKAS